jgi:hypothetical protein
MRGMRQKADSQPTELCETLRLSGSFEPSRLKRVSKSCDLSLAFDLALLLSWFVSPKRTRSARERALLLRKEVIQPQVPLRLPCYDFIPITGHTLGTRGHFGYNRLS